MTRYIVSSLICALAATAGSPASAETYSFESPVVGTFTYNPTTYAGATFNAKSGVAANTFFSATPPNGSQAAFIQSADDGQGVVGLSFTGLTAGASYTASFYLAQRPNYAVNPLSVAFDGATLGSFSAPDTNFIKFTTAAFLVGGTSGTLSFTGAPTTTGDNDVALDLVTLSLVSGSTPAAVPEPASWAMMIGGFGLVGAAARRTRTLKSANA